MFLGANGEVHNMIGITALFGKSTNITGVYHYFVKYGYTEMICASKRKHNLAISFFS